MMNVYVDDMKASFGRMVMCHMIADTHAELAGMAERIGVQRRWLQYPGTYREHFDICMSKRAKAVALGAKEVTRLELGRIIMARRDKSFKESPSE